MCIFVTINENIKTRKKDYRKIKMSIAINLHISYLQIVLDKQTWYQINAKI